MVVLNFIVNEILSQPPLLVGLIALIGLLIQRQSTGNVISGTFKTIIGFYILTGGAGIVIGTLTPLGAAIETGLHLHGVIPTNEAIVGLAQKAFGTQTAIIMAVGFIVNVALARFTPAKFVFLTGHHLLFMATVLAVVLGSSGISSINQIILGAIILGTIATVMPAFVHPFTRKLTGDAPFALGHFNSFGYLISALVGKAIGGGSKGASKTTEEINVPEGASFLRDSLVMTTATMIVIYLIITIIAGPAALAQYTGGSNYIMYALTQAFTFGAGVAVILAGVRMILGEIVPAFKGFADLVVPDATPALDCPTTFPFAPNAVLIGFICSLIGGIVGLFLMGPIGLALIIPGLVPHFFDGGTAGVYGNIAGGRRGAIVGAFINGLIITVLPALLLSFLGSLGLANTTFGDSDFALVGILAGLTQRTGLVGSYIITIIAAVILLALASFITLRGNRRHNEEHLDEAQETAASIS